jgi:hypothetical protein
VGRFFVVYLCTRKLASQGAKAYFGREQSLLRSTACLTKLKFTLIMYNETKFNELKELVEDNANLLSEIELAQNNRNELESAQLQDGEFIMTQDKVQEMCKAATQKADIKEVRVMSAYCKHYYELVKYMSECLDYDTHLRRFVERSIFELSYNQEKIQQILAEDIFD